MKKKVLATLLAVCLFVGLAVPAVFAASSDAAGDAKKVSKITLAKAEYTITEGKTIDFADEIAVFENDTKLVLDHGHIQYSLLANVGSSADFEIDGSVVKALKPGATATLTVYDNYGEKARTTAKIKSVAATAASTKKIESFTFGSNLYTLPVGTDAEAQTFVVESHPKGTVFTEEAKDAADEAVETALAAVDELSGITVTSELIADGTKIQYTIDASDLEGLAVDNKNHAVKAEGSNFVNGKAFSTSTSFRFVTAIKATGISVAQELTVKVGERVDLPKVTYYPTNANVGKKVEWDIIPYINDGNAYQYAIVDGDKILGVNSNTPAKARLQVILDGKGTTETIVNVKPANFVGQVTPTIPATASVEVGKTYTYAVSNLPAGVTVKWEVKDAKIATIKDGVVTGVAAGSTEVTATLSTGEVLKSTLTVKAAAAPTTPSKPGATTNPQTGDSIFANLF